MSPASPVRPVRARPASIWSRLYNGETSFDFVGRRRRWFLLSAAVILVGLVSLLTRGLNFGIDFEGGTAWEVKANGVSVARARDALRPLGLGEAKIQVVGDVLRVQADPEGDRAAQERTRNEVTERLAQLTGEPGSAVSVSEVGPTWGGEITRKAGRALVFFLVAIAAYISLRFEWKMAVAALAAVVHDVLVTVGVYSLSGFEVTPATVIAFLTILGYSLYDTIVVFDKVEENSKGLGSTGRLTYADTVNLSMNQVLMRSLNTSLVAILPILSVLVIGSFVLGATTLQDFGLALLIGLLTGAYSSIFIASPLLAMLKEREPRYAAIRQRLAARGAGAGSGGEGAPLTPAAAAAGAGLAGPGGRAARAGGPPTSSRTGRPGRAAPSGGLAEEPEELGERAPDQPGQPPLVPGRAAGRSPSARPGGARPAPRPRKKGKRR